MAEANSPLRAAIGTRLPDEDVVNRILQRAVDVMVRQGVPARDITFSLLGWAVVAAREVGEREVWSELFRRASEMVDEQPPQQAQPGTAPPSGTTPPVQAP